MIFVDIYHTFLAENHVEYSNFNPKMGPCDDARNHIYIYTIDIVNVSESSLRDRTGIPASLHETM